MQYGNSRVDLWILHRSGKHNSNADALSKVPLEQSELHKAQKQQKKTYDQHARPPNFALREIFSI